MSYSFQERRALLCTLLLRNPTVLGKEANDIMELHNRAWSKRLMVHSKEQINVWYIILLARERATSLL
jgi:hypothetical protein